MENLKPVMIIIAGPNGSGKTSVTKKLLSHHWFDGCEYINPDAIAQEMFGDWNNEDSVIKAANYATELRTSYIEQKKSFVLETVFSHESKLDLIRDAKAAGFFVRFFFISTNSPVINAARVAESVMEGGHDVPITKIISRYSKSITNSIEASKISDRAYFYDNSIDFEAARLLMKFNDGKLVKFYGQDISKVTWIDSIVAESNVAKAESPQATSAPNNKP